MAADFDVNGRWTGIITTPDGNEPQLFYDFRVDGDRLTGTAEWPGSVVTVDNGKVVGNAISFWITVDGTDYPHAGRVTADACTLDIDFASQKSQTTLRRDTSR